MVLGALIDAGLPLEDLRTALGSLAVDRDAVWTERVTRAGITATKFHVRGEPSHDHEAGSHQHGAGSHGHATADSHHHAHRTVAEIHCLISGSALSNTAKTRAKDLFTTLGETEAAIHGTTIDK